MAKKENAASVSGVDSHLLPHCWRNTGIAYNLISHSETWQTCTSTRLLGPRFWLSLPSHSRERDKTSHPRLCLGFSQSQWRWRYHLGSSLAQPVQDICQDQDGEGLGSQEMAWIVAMMVELTSVASGFPEVFKDPQKEVMCGIAHPFSILPTS